MQHIRRAAAKECVRSGITRLEVAVGLGIPLLLVILILPAIQQAREEARRSTCKYNLKQFGLAVENYHDSYRSYPHACMGSGSLPVDRRLSHIPSIGNYLQHYGWPIIDVSLAWDDPAQRPFMISTWTNGPLKEFDTDLFPPMGLICPSDDRSNLYFGQPHMSYVGVLGVGPDAGVLSRKDAQAGFWSYQELTTSADITDGKNHTLTYVESHTQAGCWLACGSATMRHIDSDDQPYLGPSRAFGGLHPGGTQGVLADGSVRFISEEVDSEIFSALCTIAGNESPRLWGE